jgi:hypothetical protein
MAFDRILPPTNSDGIAATRALGGDGTVPA